MPSSSKSFLKTSFKPYSYSSKRSSSSSKDDNTYVIVIIAVLLFAIIAGTIIYSSYNKEKFTNKDNKLIYLYMEQCGHCKNFTPEWEKMATKINNDANSKFYMTKYDLNDNSEGTKLSTANKIDYAPAIVLITPNKNEIYNGNRSEEDITKWVLSKV
jgi:hypothetical protein